MEVRGVKFVFIGATLLVIVAALIYLGLGQRALDRLRLSDRAALIFLAVMLVGGLVSDIPLSANWSINIGGGIVPLVLAGYLWSRAEPHEITRSVIAVLVTGGVIYGLMKILPTEPTYYAFMDPLYIGALAAGVIGYLAGRSRRGAFLAGTLGIILTDIAAQVENALSGVAGGVSIGGAGVFDAVLISGFLALGLAEVVGETREHFARNR